MKNLTKRTTKVPHTSVDSSDNSNLPKRNTKASRVDSSDNTDSKSQADDDDDPRAMPRIDRATMPQRNQAAVPAICDDLASSSESESDDEVSARKCPRSSKKENQERKKWPRAGDFGDIQQKIISEANSYY